MLCCAVPLCGWVLQRDDACSAVPRSALAYRNLQFNPQQLEQLQKRQQGDPSKKALKVTDENGAEQQVKRVDDPEVVQVCRLVPASSVG